MVLDQIVKRDKNELSEYNKNYYEKNKDKILENKREYCVNLDKDKFNERTNNYINDRILKDPLFKLKRNIRTLIYVSFKNKFTKRAKRTNDILGCSFEDFKLNIELKFKDGMNWDNHGKSNTERKWQLDHIIPISSAKTEEEVYKLNHYTNFQPLWESDNRTKGKRF
jgi:hypothetical protein